MLGATAFSFLLALFTPDVVTTGGRSCQCISVTHEHRPSRKPCLVQVGGCQRRGRMCQSQLATNQAAC